MTRDEVAKYFKPFPKWAIKVLLAGLVIAVLGGVCGNAMENGGMIAGAVVLGLLMIVGAILGIVSWTKRPSDADYDEWVEQCLGQLGARSLTKMGIDSSELVGDPVQITGPRFWDVANAPISWKKGEDGWARFTPMGVTILNFSENQLMAYMCVLDMYSGSPLNESSDEFFYKHVVSVSTKQQSYAFGSWKLNSAETFILTTAGGNAIEVILKDPALVQKMGGDIPTTRAEKALQTVRKMLREKQA